MDFKTLAARHLKRENYSPHKILSLDPGETTGWAVFENGELLAAGQLDTSAIEQSAAVIQSLIKIHTPAIVVYEDYRVYGWKADAHSWAALHTPQLIGAIKTICSLLSIPTHTQMAQVAKQFCTDTKLKEWGMYQKGLKHARDAIRHGCYFILFNQHKVAIKNLPSKP